MEVKQVLEIDNLSRNSNAVRKLYTHLDLDTNKSWDFSLPTLVSNENPFHNSELKKINIKKRFNDKYPDTKNSNNSTTL